MKIAGFEITKKGAIRVGVVVGIIAALSAGSAYSKNKELQERRRAEEERLANMPKGEVKEQEDLHTQIQRKLTEKFGVAPEGFEWAYDGSLTPLSDESSCEDVVYTFLRAVSVLDFSTAERYSVDSSVVSEYQDYYGIAAQSINDYYKNFLRKQLKYSISSLEVVNVSDIAIFADGTEYVTVTVKAMDLGYKDFWYKDKWDLFRTMYDYGITEDDDTKQAQYVYDYLLSKYDDGSIGKKEYKIEIVVSKQTNGGWLVTNDKELMSILSYESGVDVAQFIFDAYQSFELDHITEYLPDVIEEERIKDPDGDGFSDINSGDTSVDAKNTGIEGSDEMLSNSSEQDLSESNNSIDVEQGSDESSKEGVD